VGTVYRCGQPLVSILIAQASKITIDGHLNNLL